MKQPVFTYKKACLLLLPLLLVGSGIFGGCNTIMEDRKGCPTDSYIHFKYDYNIKFADAFEREVSDITLYIYDDQGEFLDTRRAPRQELLEAAGKWPLNLQKGTYQVIAVGTEPEGTFEETRFSKADNFRDEFNIVLQHTNQIVNQLLTPLFYGKIEQVTVGNAGEVTPMSLVKNTKRIRVVLQQTTGAVILASDFKFEIIDDNGVLDSRNNIVAGNTRVYQPYVSGEGVIEGTPTVSYVYAEISTNRLVTESKARLKVMRTIDEKQIIDIPLIDFMLMNELEGNKGLMTDQEYLDRQDAYKMTFFLTGQLNWMDAQIIINGWVIRLNNEEI